MYIADYKSFDTQNGEGIRASLYVSGCKHYCKGCFNKKAWSYTFGEPFSKELEDRIIADLKDEKHPRRGLSLLGGEPIDSAFDLIPLLKRVKEETGKSVWMWTGYEIEHLSSHPVFDYVDVLVDGKFNEDLKDPSLRFKGSSNQRVIDIKKSREDGKVVLLHFNS